MTSSFRFSACARTLAAALALPGWALAQTAVPSITDPAVFVPPARYRSVFADTPTGVEQDRVDWKKANADVGGVPPGTAHQQHTTGDAAPAAAPPAHAHHH